MDIKTLKIIIADLPDNFEIYIEYDGPDALVDKDVDSIYISHEHKNIVLMSKSLTTITK